MSWQPTQPACHLRIEDGTELSTLLWRFGAPVTCVSTASVGGGFTRPLWIVNAQVTNGYRRTDLQAHAKEITANLSVHETGVVMFTAVDVRDQCTAEIDDVVVTATVGVREPVWAAGLDETLTQPAVGTVNVVVQIPVPMSAAALVNLVATVTEAKCQAFMAHGVPGTGTPTDAVTIVCPPGADEEPFGGPRSKWGARAADAAYRAISAGLGQC